MPRPPTPTPVEPKTPVSAVNMRAITPLEARGWMPQVAGIDVRLDDRRLMRWQVRYPNDHPPYWHQAIFGDETVRSQSSALKDVLEWAWACARTPCPWDLSPLDF